MANNMCSGKFINILKNTQVLSHSIKPPINVNKRAIVTKSSRIIRNPMFRQHSIHSHVLRTSTTQKILLPSTLVLYQTIYNNDSRYYSTKNDEPNSRKTNEVKSDESKNEEKKEESKEKKSKFYELFNNENAWKVGLASLALMGSFLIGQLLVVWGSPPVDVDGNTIKDEYSDLPAWKAYPLRTIKEMNFFTKMIQDPSSTKLLPDPLKEPWYQPKYTLVLGMTGVLVHPDWTLATGWRFKKRPAVEYFLSQVASPLFEIVIYTSEQGFTAFPIIDGLDKNQTVAYRLFRDATKYVNGHHVKDLDCLNRDLSKVIVVDCDSESVQLHPRNGFILPRWKGEDQDRHLVQLASFLKLLASSDVEDVRSVLDHYKGYDDPIVAFRENQRTLQEQQEKVTQASEEPKTFVQSFRKSGGSLFSKF